MVSKVGVREVWQYKFMQASHFPNIWSARCPMNIVLPSTKGSMAHGQSDSSLPSPTMCVGPTTTLSNVVILLWSTQTATTDFRRVLEDDTWRPEVRVARCGSTLVGLPLCTSFWWVASRWTQGSPNLWEPVRFDRLPVKPVRPGSGLGRYQIGPNSKFKFEFKKIKKFLKIPKNISRCDESNGVKFSQKFIHLV